MTIVGSPPIPIDVQCEHCYGLTVAQLQRGPPFCFYCYDDPFVRKEAVLRLAAMGLPVVWDGPNLPGRATNERTGTIDVDKTLGKDEFGGGFMAIRWNDSAKPELTWLTRQDLRIACHMGGQNIWV